MEDRSLPADDLGDEVGHQFAPRRSSSNCSGFSHSAISPPLIELRVVSLPPTISSPKLPMNSRASMFRVAAECAIIEIRSKGGGAAIRSFHKRGHTRHLHQLGHALGLAIHHRVRRIDVGDRDVRPAGELPPVFPGEVEQGGQHHVGEIGRDPLDPVEGLAARQRVEHGPGALADQLSMLARLDGATIGATVCRCAVWPGGSMRMKFGRSCPLGWSATWMPPSSEADE